MKKKLLSMIMCGALALSLVACGGSSSEGTGSAPTTTESPAAESKTEESKAPESTAAAETPAAVEEAATGEVSDETWGGLQEMYAMLVEEYNLVAEVYNDDSIMPNAEIEEGMSTAATLIEEIGNVAKEDVTEESAVAWVDAMLAVNEIFGAILETFETSQDVANQIAAGLNTAYAGITDDENTYAYLGFGDEIAALMFYDASTGESGSFVGAYEVIEESGQITISDETNGMAITFAVEEYETGFILDMGDVGAAFVEPVDAADLAVAYVNISLGSAPQF